MPLLPPHTKYRLPSVLAWPAYVRVLCVVPVLGLLWLAVLWASADVVPL